jgi:hypothetical protein
VCDGWLPVLVGNQEETVTDAQGNVSAVNEDYGATGVHSHDDGVIHYHPFSGRAVGRRAKLSVFLDVYNVELDTDHLKLPAEQGGDEYSVDDYQCNGEDVEIKVVAWDTHTDTGKGSTYITDLADVRISQNNMVFAIVVAPPDKDIVMPPWAANLLELGAADQANVPETTIVGSDNTTVDTITVGTVTGDTSTGDTSTGDTSTGDTSPGTSTGDTSTGDTSSVTATTGG